MANAALRLPDVHDDDGHHDDPGDPCPVCIGPVDDGVCFLCGLELCETCGKVEVTGQAAKCAKCAPLYEVRTLEAVYYRGRNLRRAWEALGYLDERRLDVLLLVPGRVDIDTDGLTDRESNLCDEWASYENGRGVPVHTCVAPSDNELARRAKEGA